MHAARPSSTIRLRSSVTGRRANRYVRPLLIARAAALKATCTGFGLRFVLHSDWTTDAIPASRTVSENVNIAVAIRMNRKLAEMVPVILGSRTLNVAVSKARAKQM